MRRLAALAIGVGVSWWMLPMVWAAALVEGMLSPTDLLSPVDLQVTPLVEGGSVATRDGRLLPAVARWDGAQVDAAVREFDAAFAGARAVFLDALEAAFGVRVLDAAKSESLRFRSFRSEFITAHPEFPVGYVLAAAWARGDDGELIRARLAGVLRKVLERELIGEMPRAGTVFCVAVPADTVVRSWSEASPAIVRVADGGSVVSLEAARAALWAELGVGERFAGGYLERLVRETVRYDARLTALFLHERLGAALEGRFIGRGEVIVRAGVPIDGIAAEALRQLEQLGLAPLMVASHVSLSVPEPAGSEPGRSVMAAAVERAPSDIAPASVSSGAARVGFGVVLPVGWMAATVVLGVVSLGLGLWMCVRLRGLRRWSAMAGVGPGAAELREVLAREMTRRGMDALFAQRQELLETTVVATERVADLESRVAKVQPAIQEKMRSYERRIRALERELQEK